MRDIEKCEEIIHAQVFKGNNFTLLAFLRISWRLSEKKFEVN